MKNIILISLSLIVAKSAIAETTTKNLSEDFYKKSVSLVEKYQTDFSTYLGYSAEYFDGYWIKDKKDKKDKKQKDENNSFGIFRIGTSYSSEKGYDAQLKMKLKYHLPNMKKNLNVFFDINDDTNKTLADQSNIIKHNSNKDSLSAGLLYEKNKGKWKTKYRIGAKISTPINPFVKAEIYRTKKITENFNIYMGQSVFYYKEEGLGTATNADFRYNLKNQDYLQSSYTLQYLKEEEWELFSYYTYLQNINKHNILKYNIGAVKEVEKNVDNFRYWTNVKWRHQLYKNWLFLKLTPEISFEKTYNYKPEYKFLVEFEMFFGSKKGIQIGTNRYKYK